MEADRLTWLQHLTNACDHALSELELRGSFRFNDEIDEVIDALSDGSLQIAPVITHEFPVHRALDAFGLARNAAESGKVLLDFRAG